MFKRIMTLLMVSVVAATAHAETNNDNTKAGNIAVFITDPFSSSSIGGLNISSTSYNIGGFVIDDLMVFGGLRVLRASGDNNIGLNAGTRYYMHFDGTPVRTFVDGSLSVADADYDQAANTRLVTLGGFAGAEIQMTPYASLAARVGISVTDINSDVDAFDTTVINFGSTDLVLNIYF